MRRPGRGLSTDPHIPRLRKIKPLTLLSHGCLSRQAPSTARNEFSIAKTLGPLFITLYNNKQNICDVCASPKHPLNLSACAYPSTVSLILSHRLYEQTELANAATSESQSSAIVNFSTGRLQLNRMKKGAPNLPLSCTDQRPGSSNHDRPQAFNMSR